MPAYMYVQHIRAWYLGSQKGVLGALNLEL